jgi:hypothetical protein
MLDIINTGDVYLAGNSPEAVEPLPAVLALRMLEANPLYHHDAGYITLPVARCLRHMHS